MKLKELSQLPNAERLRILEAMKMEGPLPSNLELYYEVLEKARIKSLSPEEKGIIFANSKIEWCERYPDFKRIADVMEDFRADELLLEYTKASPPPSILQSATDVYKKCISFKVKLTKRILSNLRWHPETPTFHYHRVQYCIDQEPVLRFLHEYQAWNMRAYHLWNKVYYAIQDFFYDSGYSHDWKFIVKHPGVLKEKADAIVGLHAEVRSLLVAGPELVARHSDAIRSEYLANAIDMSLYEREQEIAAIESSEIVSDEQYCYVYTLECDLFVFYVGIAANPNERFEQHMRGASSDEAHLFKSKFIQKFRSEIKLKVVYEGTRRECKLFERAYIVEHTPLGNMTEGGEG